MTCEDEESSEIIKDLAEIDNDKASKCYTKQINDNGLLLWPVSPQESGVGHPFAPENWPNQGDNWGWKAGKRVGISGYYKDRYLYLPPRFQKAKRKRDCFASKNSVENYVRSKFPGADVDAFFSSFCWRIPSKQSYLHNDERGISSDEIPEESPSNSISGIPVCKAGNRFCPSVVKDEISISPCDVCCSEPGFCLECCCILCCNTIDVSSGGYSFIRCQATLSDGSICNHAAHIDCALRSYLAGTVGGGVELDTEYYCRRCDTRTDLTNHVTSLLKTCESVESQEYVERILSVGSCILRGSEKKGSQELLSRIESILHKFKSESVLKDVWKAEADAEVEPVIAEKVDKMNDTLPEKHENENLRLDDEIDHVLKELRKSQEQEFRIAQEKLLAQKDYVVYLYKHIEKQKKELTKDGEDGLITSILVNEEHLKRALVKFKDMEKIAYGFGKTPKTILKDYFDLDLDV